MAKVRKSWLVIMALAVVGLLAGVLTLVPQTQASSPSETLTGSFITSNSNLVFTPRGNGALMIESDVIATFTSGGIEGHVEASLTSKIKPGGGFTLHAQGGIFEGKIDGREGTARFNATAHGVTHPSIAGCCYQGALTFYDGTDGLEGLAGAGVLTFDPINGRRYSVDVHFR